MAALDPWFNILDSWFHEHDEGKEAESKMRTGESQDKKAVIDLAEKMKLSAIIEANTAGFKRGMAQIGSGLSMAGGRFGRFIKPRLCSSSLLKSSLLSLVSQSWLDSSRSQSLHSLSLRTLTRTRYHGWNDSWCDWTRENRSGTTRSWNSFNGTSSFWSGSIAALAGFKEVDLVDAKGLRKPKQSRYCQRWCWYSNSGFYAISSLRGMGMEVEDLSKVNDVLLQTMNNSFTTIETLGETMKLLAPTATALEISLEEAQGSRRLLGNAGIQATNGWNVYAYGHQ